MQNQGEIDALIIENLAEIEQAHDRISGHIQDVLQRETGKIFREVAHGAGWYCKADSLDDDFWMARPAWKVRKGDADHEADHLVVAALDWDSTRKDVSWVGQFVGSQGSRLLVKVASDKFTPKRWTRLLEHPSARTVVEELGKTGLRLDQNNSTEPFAACITIAPQKLALAYSGEMEFETALEPMKKVLQDIVGLEHALDELADIARRARN